MRRVRRVLACADEPKVSTGIATDRVRPSLKGVGAGRRRGTCAKQTLDPSFIEAIGQSMLAVLEHAPREPRACDAARRASTMSDARCARRGAPSCAGPAETSRTPQRSMGLRRARIEEEVLARCGLDEKLVRKQLGDPHSAVTSRYDSRDVTVRCSRLARPNAACAPAAAEPTASARRATQGASVRRDRPAAPRAVSPTTPVQPAGRSHRLQPGHERTRSIDRAIPGISRAGEGSTATGDAL